MFIFYISNLLKYQRNLYLNQEHTMIAAKIWIALVRVKSKKLIQLSKQNAHETSVLGCTL
jgi:hypothetical protein